MTERFAIGENVRWNWASGTGEGHITERFERRVSRTIEGKKITRAGTKDNPAYLISQKNGGKVLKLGSELRGE